MFVDFNDSVAKSNNLIKENKSLFKANDNGLFYLHTSLMKRGEVRFRFLSGILVSSCWIMLIQWQLCKMCVLGFLLWKNLLLLLAKHVTRSLQALQLVVGAYMCKSETINLNAGQNRPNYVGLFSFLV